MIQLCKTGCFDAGAKGLAEDLRAAGYEVSFELCLDRCSHCERGEIVGKVDGILVAHTPTQWRALGPA